MNQRGLLALALVGACGTQGALDQSSVTPACDEDDVACLSAGLNAPIAVGGAQPLDVQLTVPGSTTPSLTLISANPEVLEVSGGELIGKRAGVSALLIVADDIALDFLHVWVETPTRVALLRDGDPLVGALELLIGDEMSLVAVPFKDVTRLLGTCAGSWTTSGAAVDLLRDGDPRRRRVVARAPGSATITVDCLGHQATLDVEVLP